MTIASITESVNPATATIDTMSTRMIVAAIQAEHAKVAAAVAAVGDVIAQLVDDAAGCYGAALALVQARQPRGSRMGHARSSARRAGQRDSSVSFLSRSQLQDVAHHILQAIKEIRFRKECIDMLFPRPLFERGGVIGGGEDHMRHG